MERSRGSVKWFSNNKGFGFIKLETNEDVFVHFKEINGTGYKTLLEGDIVEFDIEKTDRGISAKNVDIIDKQPRIKAKKRKKNKSKAKNVSEIQETEKVTN